MPWHALGHYQGTLRTLLLQERNHPCERRFKGLIHLLRDSLQLMDSECLCPIPSWKKRHANGLPNRIANALGHPSRPLLQRRKAGLSQHHLNRNMRMSNLHNAFEAIDAAKQQSKTALWIVDDILTTGSTALSARTTLQQAGYEVLLSEPIRKFLNGRSPWRGDPDIVALPQPDPNLKARLSETDLFWDVTAL